MDFNYLRSRIVFWVQWTLSVIVGFSLSPLFAIFLALLIGPFQNDTYLTNLLSISLANGILIGFLNWLILRNELQQSGRWVLWCVIGFVVASYLTHSKEMGDLSTSVRALIFGACLGISQSWGINMRIGKDWGWLIAANILGWMIGEIIGQFVGESIGKFWYFPIVGFVVGITTGYAMIRILHDISAKSSQATVE